VMCPLHSYTYELATGREVASGGEPVQTYAVAVGPDGRVEVAVTAA
jgi:nitrite reductase (NADH) small subunit